MLNIGSWRQVTIDWLGRLQRAMGVPVTWVPLITTPDGRHDVQLAESRAIRLDGAQVWPQVSPLPIVQDVSLARPAIFNTNPVVAALITQPVEARRAAYADPRWRADAAASFPTQAPAAPRWDTYRIARSRAHPELEGLAVSRLAEERRSSVFEVLLDLALDEEDLGLRILATTANDDEEGVTRLLQGTTCTLGLSDAGAHLGQHCEADQATVFLGHWVRERRVMDLPTAVRRLTGLQADLFGIAGRGYLRPGYHADVVVFDPLEVGSGPHTRADDFPAGASRILAAQPRGLRFVLVNGTTTVVDSRPRTAGVRPGALLEFAPR
jgi:N-acyl-D-aspartate/D-glutamate deacylase